MECFKCSFEFDNHTRIPHILISCGHTICKLCINSLFSNKSMLCPQCNLVSLAPNIQAFPINLALIQIQTQKTCQNICKNHNKELEAFCNTDKKILCVSCILEDGHKSHEIFPISKAATKHREKLENIKNSVSQIEANILKEQDKLEKKQSSIKNAQNKLLAEFSELYQSVREAVDSREKEIIQKITEDAETMNIDVAEKKKLQKEMKGLIKKYQDEFSRAREEDDLAFMDNFNKRENLGDNICKKIIPSQNIDLFKQYSRGAEADFICKVIKQTFIFTDRRNLKQKEEVTASSTLSSTQKKENSKINPSEQPTIRKSPWTAKKEAITRAKSHKVLQKATKKIVNTINLNKEILSPDIDWFDNISEFTDRENEDLTLSLDLNHLKHN
ncbi:unnamed protein product [Blepharisma stoltei]|uniref:Uncharacterized protein n=1 Tax=Blepharisma stoltei TaxID=1481888 RepID=A0AAU9J4D1_9CILI|nr:unnamed protein product [Blepharisma stoltei]